jgi:hypothetical protein
VHEYSNDVELDTSIVIRTAEVEVLLTSLISAEPAVTPVEQFHAVPGDAGKVAVAVQVPPLAVIANLPAVAPPECVPKEQPVPVTASDWAPTAVGIAM